MIYEILNDAGEVINTIVANEDFVEAHHAGRYRLVESSDLPTSFLPNTITKVAFRFRLTDAEYVAILAAAKTDVAVEAWVSTFNMVSQVNLADPRTVAGVQQLVAAELLTQERGTEILTGSVLPEERP